MKTILFSLLLCSASFAGEITTTTTTTERYNTPEAILVPVVPITTVAVLPRGCYIGADGLCHPPIPTIHPNVYVGYREAYLSKALRLVVPRTPPRYRVGFIIE